ncbi:hypothetical protein [Phenylobacterium sp.]|jgi:hypothetical protein|uniref:hypothetical protein n=1 Tax=Phenylobacterium sp. TaxID=1871053 RepID=UPI002F92BCB9
MVLRALAAAALLTLSPLAAHAEPARDGRHDFDFEIGDWTTEVRVLANPLSGQPAKWVEYRGRSLVKPLMGGRANLVELDVAGPAGRIEGGSLRLYNPKSGQWSVNYVSLADGLLTAPVFGAFDGKGRGTFVGQDTLNGRTILVRFVITVLSPTEARFEQAFSGDAGQSWETNWLAVDRRIR